MIHALDYPELANLGLDAARRYARIAPGSPHALHMPSHIFVRLGLWPEAIASNLDSAVAARALFKDFPATAVHNELHALDYLEYAYLQSGQDDRARSVVEQVAALRTKEQPDFAAVYAIAAVPARYALERGDWRAAAALLESAGAVPWEKFPYAEAITVYARALGAAHLDDTAAAQAGIARLEVLQKQIAASPPAGPYDWAAHVEALRLTAAGVLARTTGRTDEALDLLARAADLEEKTGKHPVTPGTALPPRELYADLLLELGRAPEALRAYEASLLVAPNRLRSLYGAARAAELAGQTVRARTLFNLVAAIAAPNSARPEIVAARSRASR
jgi:tetratricopeptide (TPR) repeat protein